MRQGDRSQGAIFVSATTKPMTEKVTFGVDKTKFYFFKIKFKNEKIHCQM